MKILVSGSKYIDDDVLIYDTLDFYRKHCENLHIVCGGSKGTDSVVKLYCDENAVDLTIIKPDWENKGLAAGYIRNDDLINEEPDLFLVFWDGQSPGTADLIKKAKDIKLNTLIVYGV